MFVGSNASKYMLFKQVKVLVNVTQEMLHFISKLLIDVCHNEQLYFKEHKTFSMIV